MRQENVITNSEPPAKLRLALALTGLLFGGSEQANAALLWNWSYAGPGVSASGTFETNDTPNAEGFYEIAGLAGTANGGVINRLQATGTTIPGNSGFVVDNLISASEPQLTKHGFGFCVANNECHNPFYSEKYLDYVSTPPYVDGKGTEPIISFRATRLGG